MLGMLIVVNLTLFVSSGLVAGFKYYFPLIALTLFGIVQTVITFPTVNLKSSKVYWFCFSLAWLGIYFTMASVIYMLEHGDFKYF